MSERNAFILARANATRSAQASIAGTWLWEEKTIAQWDADITAFETQHEAVTDAESEKDAQTGELDAQLAQLHERTRLGLSLMRNKFRDDPAKIHALKTLSVGGGSRARVMEEALEWESTWEKLDETWLCNGQTLAQFKQARNACEALIKSYAEAKAQARTELGKWNTLGDRLNGACIAWYEAATSLFKAGTTEGDMIRGTVPTTYQPMQLPEKAVIESAVSETAGTVAITFHAENATAYDVFRTGANNMEFAKVAENWDETGIMEENLAPGAYRFKVIGRNSRGTGPESEVAQVNVQ